MQRPEMEKTERRAHRRHELKTAAEITVEAVEEVQDPADLRSHERVAVAYEINIEAGLNIGGHEVMRLKLVGKTIDISRGGMLIRVEREVAPGAHCNVHFPDAEGQIEPDTTWGRVRRSEMAGDFYRLAVQFDVPLEVLNVPAGLQA